MTDSLFRYVGLASTFPPPFEDALPLNDEIEALFKKYIAEAQGAEMLAKVQGMFTNVLAAVTELRSHTDARIEEVREEVKGVRARVTVLEGERRSPSLAPRQIKALETYEKSPTGTFRLTDFELHDLHAEAQTWRSIKSFARAAAIPVAAALLLTLLAFIGLHVWGK